MYEDFYGLSELPFELTANPKYLFLSAAQREALSIVQYGLSSAKALTLLIGDAGTGKTTLIQAALESDRCHHVRCIYLNNPTLTAAEFVKLLAHKFGLSAKAADSKATLLTELESLLREGHEAGLTNALVVDEAQSLSLEMLEEIRFLANIETPSVKLLPVVLAGQPELASRLEEQNLRQLKQRVTLRALLQPFGLDDTAAYIASRIVTAGGVPGGMFSLEAVTLIHELSGGIPRTISVLCDNALVTGMALGRRRIDRATVLEVGRDLHLTGKKLTTLGEPLRQDHGPVSQSAAPATPPVKTEEEREQPPDVATESSRREPRRSTVTAISPRVGRTIT
jgi:general secretion pathway protein A